MDEGEHIKETLKHDRALYDVLFTYKKEMDMKEALIRALCDELCRRDFTAYAKRVYRGMWQPAQHHRIVADVLTRVLDGSCRRLMVFMPPRHGKSMQITECLPSYFLGRYPDKRVIVLSYSSDLAARFGRENRAKIAEYGHLFDIALSKTNAGATAFDIKDHRGGLLSVGFGGSITGQGADLLIIDDPVKNREEAESKTMRDKIFAEYQSTAYTRLQAGAAIIIVMTRWHEDDLCGRLLAQSPDEWEVLSLPALAEQGDTLGRKVGEPLWPQMGYDKDWAIQTQRAVGSYAFAALYQQRPAPAGGGLIRRSWWKFYDELPEMVTVVLSVDAAFKGGEDADNVSIQAWGKRGAYMYLLDDDTQPMDFPKTLRAIRAMHQKHKPRCVYIEDKANGPAILSMLHSEIAGLIPVNPQGGKIARAHAVSAAIESGNVFLPRTPGAYALIDECAAFPNGAHDDRVDAMTQALNQFIHHDAQVEAHKAAVKWHKDQWEDYNNASEPDREVLIQRWGDPYG